MFRIGEFSKMCRVSVRMLRHYDELGLFKPARVDNLSGYRYYTATQLTGLNRLRALRDMGLSLEQIRPLLSERDELTPEQIKGMLKLKELELEQKISESKNQLVKVKAWLQHLERKSEPQMSINQSITTTQKSSVVIKKVEAVRVASIREVTAGYTEVGRLYTELLEYLTAQGLASAGPAITVYYGGAEYNEDEVDQQACLPIASDATLNETARIKVHELPAIEAAASLIHVGPWEELGETYETLTSWIGVNGYQIGMPSRDILLRGEPDFEPSDYSCEIMFPVN